MVVGNQREKKGDESASPAVTVARDVHRGGPAKGKIRLCQLGPLCGTHRIICVSQWKAKCRVSCFKIIKRQLLKTARVEL